MIYKLSANLQPTTICKSSNKLWNDFFMIFALAVDELIRIRIYLLTFLTTSEMWTTFANFKLLSNTYCKMFDVKFKNTNWHIWTDFSKANIILWSFSEFRRTKAIFFCLSIVLFNYIKCFFPFLCSFMFFLSFVSLLVSFLVFLLFHSNFCYFFPLCTYSVFTLQCPIIISLFSVSPAALLYVLDNNPL